MVSSIAGLQLGIETAPVSLDCRVILWLETGKHQAAIIAKILQAHVATEILIDRECITIYGPAIKIIPGLHGAGW